MFKIKISLADDPFERQLAGAERIEGWDSWFYGPISMFGAQVGDTRFYWPAHAVTEFSVTEMTEPEPALLATTAANQAVELNIWGELADRTEGAPAGPSIIDEAYGWAERVLDTATEVEPRDVTSLAQGNGVRRLEPGVTTPEGGSSSYGSREVVWHWRHGYASHSKTCEICAHEYEAVKALNEIPEAATEPAGGTERE